MLPGPVHHPPPLPLGFIGSPSPPPSDPESSSIGASVAIIVIIIIATITLTTCVVLLRRGCLRRQGRLSSSSFSCCSSESGMQSVASAAVVSAVSSVANSAEEPVKGSELVASVPVSAEMPKGGMDSLVPSAPYLPEVERLILELLLLPAVPMKPGSRDCAICREFLPTDVLLILPVCSHMFHQSCIINWLRRTTPSCCPSCHASITIPGSNKTKIAPNFCSVEYDIESQMLMPNPPGKAVADVVGESHGWLRSSLDRLSGSWRGCSSNRATTAVVPMSSRRTTGSWSQSSSGRLGNDSDCTKVQKPLPVPDGKEVPEAVRGSIRWLRSLATLSGSWSGCSSNCSSEMGLPVTSRHVTETLASSGHSETDTWSRRWDLEAATPTPESPAHRGYARWFFRSSGNYCVKLHSFATGVCMS